MSYPLQILPGTGSGSNPPEFNLTDTISSREEAISADERMQIEQGDFLYCEPIRLEWTEDIGASSDSALRLTSGTGSYGTEKETQWIVPFRGYEKYVQFRCNVKENFITAAGLDSELKAVIRVVTSNGDSDNQTFYETNNANLEDDDFVHLGNFIIPEAWLTNIVENGGSDDLLIKVSLSASSSGAANNLDLYAPTVFVIRMPYSRS